MLKIESRSVTGEVKVYEPQPGYEDEEPHPYAAGRHFPTWIQQRVFENVYDVLKPIGNNPHKPKIRTVAKGFATPEEALEWMEENRGEWDD